MPLLKRARLTQGAFSRHFSSKKELLREAIDERVYSRAVHAGRVGILYWAERSLDSYFLASLQSLRFLRIDVCPIEKCLFNGRYARICAPGHGWQVSPGNAARGRDPDSKDPLAGKHGSGLDGSWFAVYPTIETLVAQVGRRGSRDWFVHSRHARIAAMQPLAEAFGKIARIPILQRRSRHYTNRKIFAYKRHRTQPGVEIASKDCTRDSAKLLWGAFQSGATASGSR